MNQDALAIDLKKRARELGFTLAGVAPAVAPPGAARLDEWLARGYAGDMHYLADRRDAYADPAHVLEGVRSILMLALPYRTAEAAMVESGQGRVARYAWGSVDYHELVRDRLHDLADYLRELVPAAVTRGVVDTAPLLEREFAQLAGLGWIGKNTLLLNRDAGSYFFLAALLTDVELPVDAPHLADHCGTCTACLAACPTQAFPQPYVLDASRCISYLTIEHRGEIPEDLRRGIGDWLFGCDICQEVCPWNHHASKQSEASRGGPPPPAPAPVTTTLAGGGTTRLAVKNELASQRFAPLPDSNPLDLIPLFDLSEADFRARFRHTPLWRPHRRGLLRNAAIVLGNQRATAALPALNRGLADDEPLVRDACAWAIAQIKSDS
jgi:epoxyqueuosine reductase